jgi:hypothetical protein
MIKALPAYLAIGLLAFAPALNAWFVADDWDFLILVAKAKSAAICFVPLVGRFVRPLVMATYYVNYHLFGLRPFPYHLTLVVIHALNAWLVCLLAERLGLSKLVAFGAGLIFLVFSGHAEAVTWVAGAADPWLVLLLIPALLFFDRGLSAQRPAVPLAAACVMLAAGGLAKETAVIGPALVMLYGASRLFVPMALEERRKTIARTLIVASISAGVAVAFLAVRAQIFGSVFGAYSQLGTSRGIVLAEARAFVLRAFLPAGDRLVQMWLHGYDLILFAAAALFVIAVFIRRPDARRGLAFLVPAFIVGLGPALPLSISLLNTVSERYVYVATAFSSILAAWSAELLFPRRRLAAGALIALLAAVHLVALEGANRRWIAAGTLAQTIMSEVIHRVRETGPATRTLVLNLPDTADGAFVGRGAFYGSFYLQAPDVQDPERRVGVIASTALTSTTERARVTQTGPRSFHVAQDSGVFVQEAAPATPEYRFDTWEASSFDITFLPAKHDVQVLYASRGRVGLAGVLPGVP